MRSNTRVLGAAVVGTAIEYYDFYIYGYAAALVFGPLFFPSDSAAAQTLLALISFGIAFLARPVGAAAFGHFGDRVGRKATLIASLLLMGVCTFLIAFLPTYASAGWVAPLLLCIMRFGQGLGLGGEWAGAALLSVEHAPRGWTARFGMMPALGAGIGNILATGVFLLLGSALDENQFVSWGWRVPFLFSALLIAIGLWVRRNVEESPEFVAALQESPPLRLPLVELLRTNSGALVVGTCGSIVGFAIVYMSGPWALAQATGPLGFVREDFLLIQLTSLVLTLPLLPFVALLADHSSASRVMAGGALATIIAGIIFGPALASGSAWGIAGILVLLNCCWGAVAVTLSPWLSSLFPCHMRYSGFAFSINAGGVVGGAMTPIAAQMMSTGGGLQYVGLLVSTAALITFTAAVCARRSVGDGPAGGGILEGEQSAVLK